MFDFSKALRAAFDIGKSFLMGSNKQGNLVDTVFDAGADVETDSSVGGFLGFVKKGAQVYVGMMDDKDSKPLFKTPELPEFKAESRYTPGVARSSGQSRYTPTNTLYQEAIIRRMKQMNFEKNLERMTASTTVRPTAARRSPDKPGTQTIKRTTGAPRLTLGD